MAKYLGCSTNAVIAFDYLIAKGLSDFQAAAIIGNLQWESGLIPTRAVMDTNGKISRGVAMWQPPRWADLLAFAGGRDPMDLYTQLDFLWHELPSYGLSQLLSTSSVADAVVVFQNSFEKPQASLAHTDKRIALAQAALYACPAISTPPKAKFGVVAAAAGALALVAAAGYGIYKVMAGRDRDTEPSPPPIPTRRFPQPPPTPMPYRREF